MAAAPLRKFYRPAELAKMLGISLATVYRRIEDGVIPADRSLGARLIRIPADEFHRRFLDKPDPGPTR